MRFGSYVLLSTNTLIHVGDSSQHQCKQRVTTRIQGARLYRHLLGGSGDGPPQ